MEKLQKVRYLNYERRRVELNVSIIHTCRKLHQSNSSHCSTTILSNHITYALTAVKDQVIKYGETAFSNSKNKTNHPISSNIHPSATANKAIHSLKREGGGAQHQREHHIILTKNEAVHPTTVSGKKVPHPGC